MLRSLRPGATVSIPRAITVRRVPPGMAAFTFSGDGRASGGALALVLGSTRLIVRVNPITASVEVAGF